MPNMTNSLKEIGALLEAGKAEETPEEDVVEDVVDDIEEEVEETTDEVEEAPEEPADEPESYTMKSLAEAIEMPLSDMYGVLIPMEGDEEPIPVGEMKNKYQTVVRENKGLQEQISKQKEQQQAGATPIQLSQQEMAASISVAAIQKEFNETDWKELEEVDPGQAALERQKLEARYSAATNDLRALENQRQVANSEAMVKAHEKMMEIIPQWKDEALKKDDLTQMGQAMLDVGYDQSAVDNIADPYAMRLLRELITLRKEKAEGQKTLKKVKPSLKALKKSGAPSARKGEATAKLVSKAKKSRDKNDTLNAVKSILQQG